jgi:hypothetical protein
MTRPATAMFALLVVLATTAALPLTASAALRVPQIPVLGGTLQAYFNGIGESINVNTDQDDTQSWTRTASNTTTYTIMLQNSPGAATHQIWMYNSNSGPAPVLYFLMFGNAGVLGFTTATFQPGNVMTVNRFDFDGNFLSSQVFNGVDANGFSFALTGAIGTVFTQDFRNPGGAVHALTYPGTGQNAGTWWLCWEEGNAAGPSDQDFDDEVLLMESVNPTPVSKTSWGQLKSRFR